MDRDLLNVFLRSGPARKYDAAYFTSKLREPDSEASEPLFRLGFLNDSILFKTVIADGSQNYAEISPVSTLVFMPYDLDRPSEGGESFVFCEQNFEKYAQFKMRADSIDYAAFDADMRVLTVFNSVPTFSPLIIELAFDRAGLKVPPAYLDMTPEIRSKLMSYLKDRIRPLIVAAYDRGSGVNVDRAVEDMTMKLLTLSDTRDIMPFVKALHIPPENAVEVLSSWIGITYFEHEYASIQIHLREFSDWVTTVGHMRFSASKQEREYLRMLMDYVTKKLKSDWKSVVDLAKEYRDTYSDLVYENDARGFTKFLLNCRDRYWDMGDTLGRFEQTVITWRQFRRQLSNTEVSSTVLTEFFALLRKVHGAPPRASVAVLDPRPSESGGFASLACDLF